MVFLRRVVGAGTAAVIAAGAFAGMTGPVAAAGHQTPNNPTAVPRPATTDSGTPQPRGWCSEGEVWYCDGGYTVVDGGPNYVWAMAYKGSNTEVAATFTPYGDELTVVDHFSNDHWTMATLWVEGIGTKNYYSYGLTSYTRRLDLPENRKMWLRVCTSKYAAAVCTGKYHRTT